MAKVGLFYGSTTGKTADAAEQVQSALGGESVVDLTDIADTDASSLAEYDYLIIACPTWNIGDIQDDWAAVFDDLDDVDFSGKTVAYFGTGIHKVISVANLVASASWRKKSLVWGLKRWVIGPLKAMSTANLLRLETVSFAA